MILRKDWTVQTAQGQAVAGAEVYVLTQPADVDALTPLATVYSDSTGTPAPNPAITDGLGQVALYLDNAQLYTFVVISPLLETQVYPDQNLGNAPATSTPFGGGLVGTPGGIITGTVDGTNRIYTIPFTPSLLYWQYNQGVLVPGVGYTTAVVAGVFTITVAIAPQVGDTLYASGIL
jgi:hypothetical protein